MLRKFDRNNWKDWLFVAALCVLLIVAAKSQVTEVKRAEMPVRPKVDYCAVPGKQEEKPAEKRVPKIDYRALVQTHADQAGRRNTNALKSFEVELNRIIDTYERKFRNATDTGAEEIASYSSCCYLVYCMAWDQVTGDKETETYIDTVMSPHLQPLARDFAREVNAAMNRLDADLQRSTLLFAKDLASVSPITTSAQLSLDVDPLHYGDMQKGLRNLGFNAGGVAVGLGFDAVALWKTQILQRLVGKTLVIAGKLFSRQIAEVAAAITAALADGPLPFGDILAICGGLWTAYDIMASQEAFEKDANTSLRNMLDNVLSTTQADAVRRGTELVKKHQEFQDAIGSQTIEETIGGQL